MPETYVSSIYTSFNLISQSNYLKQTVVSLTRVSTTTLSESTTVESTVESAASAGVDEPLQEQTNEAAAIINIILKIVLFIILIKILNIFILFIYLFLPCIMWALINYSTMCIVWFYNLMIMISIIRPVLVI